MRSVFAMLLCSASLVGCAYSLALHPRDGGSVGTGRADGSSKTVEINLNGKTYRGPYIYDRGAVIASQGFATAFSGARVAAGINTLGTTYVQGSGNGRVLATSSDGDALRCEFTFREQAGIGVCEDNSHRQYDLVITAQ
jgi:hypothetical protein